MSFSWAPELPLPSPAQRSPRPGYSVLFLEAGPCVDRGNAVTLFQFSTSKAQNSPYPTSRTRHSRRNRLSAYYVQAGPDKFRGQQARVVGGTTWHWGGLAARFRPNDFKLKSTFGVGVDWPVSYDDIEPWYQVAEDEIGVAGDKGTIAARLVPSHIPCRMYR